jgi:putative SOS response-associated peptidase YedK
MCGRFTLITPDQELAVQFNLPEVPAMPPRYNIAPTQPVAAVRLNARSGARELAWLHWGLVPSWAQDPAVGSRLINARSETVAEKPAFRAAFQRRRCLVLADGFYEWQKVDGAKQPYYIRLRDGSPFAMAGLWEHWEGGEGSVIQSCTLLTTEPNLLIQPLHSRMPVLLAAQDYDLWLDPQVQRPERLAPLLRPYPATEMVAYPVSRRVNNPDNDDPHNIEPLSTAEDRPLPGF